MNLQAPDKNDYMAIRRLYASAFPADEKVPFFFLKRRAKQGRGTFLVAKDQTRFLGFAYLITYNDLVYLFYFAVAENARGKGHGSQMLSLLKEHYSGKQLLLAREPLTPNTPNYDQRKQRQNFYLRNGFQDLPYAIREPKMHYDVMGFGENVNAMNYNPLMGSWTGKIVRKLFKTDIVKKQLPPDFMS